MLFACIYVLDFAVQALLCNKPALFQSQAVAVLEGPDSLLKVAACNQVARTIGVTVGMTKLQAESCGEVLLEKRILEQEESAQDELIDCAYRFSPRLESTALGTITLDLTGSSRLLGNAGEIGQKLLRTANAAGFIVNVGIAANPDAALHSARGFQGLTVIAPGQESASLGPLPIEVLQPSEEISEILFHWGIKDFRSLAALPPIPLTERLGQHGLYLQRLAQGAMHRELKPVELPPSFYESMELEEPVELLEPLAFILNRLLEEVIYRLRERSLATDHVQLDLTSEVYSERQLNTNCVATATSPCQRALKLPVPTQDAKVLLRLMQLELNAHPPEAPVKKITVKAFPARVRSVQAGLFQPLAPEPAKLEITMARLRTIVGAEDNHGRGRVGFVRTLDTHRPDSFEVLSTVPKTGIRDKAFNLSCQLALRRFRPPLPARVEMLEKRPQTIIFQNMRRKVVRAAGPWRTTGAWWEADGEWQRDEWELALSCNGTTALYRVFQGLITVQWFVEGLYD